MPCPIASITSCSSVGWNMSGDMPTPLVKAGVAVRPESRLRLAADCSLQIDHLEVDDARTYSCSVGGSSAGLSLQILQISEKEASAEDRMVELHCSLNTYFGLASCNHPGIRLDWLSEADTPLEGSRFKLERVTECFCKLIIEVKATDHLRKWKCQLSQEEAVKTTLSYTTRLKDGIEEVFAAVGESLTFPCNGTSPLAAGSRARWDVDGRPREGRIAAGEEPPRPYHVNRDFAMVIGEVKPLHSGDYWCSLHGEPHKVLGKVRLHTLDIAAEYEPGGGHLNLTCLLTCALSKCDAGLNLTWDGSGPYDWSNSFHTENNTLVLKLAIDLPRRSNTIVCSVSREGAVVASKTWPSTNTARAFAWLVPPLGLLLGGLAAGLYIYVKKRRRQDTGNELAGIGMTHLYEDIQDLDHEELPQQSSKAVTSNYTLYDLLQIH